MRFGQDAVAFLKPEENGGLMESGAESEGGGGAEEGSQVVYDPVDFDNKNSTEKPRE